MENKEEIEKKVVQLKHQIQELSQELKEQCTKLEHPHKQSVHNTGVGSFGRTFNNSHWVCRDCGVSGGFESEEAPPEC